ncbi:MAG TPA: hypothetical protein VJX23_15825 [Candidatus Binataceae bacterium]|nr:hypothetical protein [Candidatus Binataceae bacterium]
MQKLMLTTIALSILLVASGCTTNNQTVQQKQACTAGNPHPWCMQLAQTKPLGSWDSNGPTNPEMREDNTPYPRNPALQLITPGHGPLTIGGMP